MTDNLKNGPNLLLEFAEVVTYPKGADLVSQGLVSQYIYRILTGACRLFYYRDGKEITSWFGFETDTITASSFFSRQPSDEVLQTLEACTLIRMSYDNQQVLFDKYPESERFVRLEQEKIIVQLEARLKGLLFQTAGERYDYLMSVFPAIMLRVPHHMVASYLGIAPETLSRMRAIR